MQALLTALIVLASAGYAVWALLPAAWRGGLQRRLLGRDSPPTAGGCGGCAGCGGGPAAGLTAAPAPADGTQVITVHRRPPAR